MASRADQPSSRELSQIKRVKKIQAARKRLLNYGVPTENIDSLSRYCADDSLLGFLLDSSKQSRLPVLTFVLVYPITIIYLLIYGDSPSSEIGTAVVWAFFVTYGIWKENRNPRLALARIIVNLCRLELRLTNVLENPASASTLRKRIATRHSILLPLDSVLENSQARAVLINQAPISSRFPGCCGLRS
jgi:hypothetical protein